MSEGSAKDVEKHTHHAQTLEYGGVQPQQQQRPRRRKLANPAPMGLFAFAATTLLLSFYNVHTRGVQVPNVVIGMSLFCGGLVQLLAGQWEVPNGNTFGATAFSAYGGFWLSYATIFIPASGVIDSFKGDMEQLNQAVGLYLIVWFMITVMFIIPVMKRSISFTILLSTLALALLMLAIGAWNGKAGVNKAGGAFGIITGFIAFYIGVGALLADESTAVAQLPMGNKSED